MSEILGPDGQTPATTDTPEAEAPALYDFEFICRTFNLVQCRHGAFNPTVVLQIHRDEESGACVLVLPDQITMVETAEGMAQIEASIKTRQADLVKIRKAQIEQDAANKINAELAAANEALAQANMMSQLKRPGARGRS